MWGNTQCESDWPQRKGISFSQRVRECCLNLCVRITKSCLIANLQILGETLTRLSQTGAGFLLRFEGLPREKIHLWHAFSNLAAHRPSYCAVPASRSWNAFAASSHQPRSTSTFTPGSLGVQSSCLKFRVRGSQLRSGADPKDTGAKAPSERG